MGSFVEMNDTLQLTRAQGFPAELDYLKHKKKPYTADDFAGKIFTFSNKSNIRLYKIPPVRNFLVENIDGKWLYWGLIYITEVTHDYVTNMTSGKFRIIYIYTPQEMRQAQQLVDRDTKTDFLK